MDNNQLVNVIKTLKKTELVFGTNNCTLRVGKSDIKVEDQDGDELISIYPEIREREYRILYSSATLDKHGTSTAQELVDFWEANNFFFDVGSQTIADGRVEFRADLPITIGFPALGAIYLVEKPTTILLGIYTTYQSGLYIKDNDTGSLSDWRRLNVKVKYTSGEFTIVDSSDQSKQLKFNVSEFSTSTTRTALWRDRDGKVLFEAINIVHVEILSDFPTPIGGFIKPVNGTIYDIHGSVNIGAIGFDFTGVNAKIQGTYEGVDEIVSTTTGNFIKGDTTFGVSIEKIKLIALDADIYYNIVGTGVEIFHLDSVISVGNNNLGNISDLSKFFIKNQCSFEGFSNGLLLAGNFDIVVFNNAFDENVGGVFLDLGTSLTASIEFSSTIFKVPNGGTALKMLPDGGNFIGGNHGLIFGNEFILTGTAIATDGYSPFDLEWNVYGNENVITSDRLLPTGWGRYSDDGTTPIVITTIPQLMTINGLGVNQDISKLPNTIRGVGQLYVSPEITPMTEGDSYDISIPLLITNKSGGATEILVAIDEGVGALPTIVKFFVDYRIPKTPPFPINRTILLTASSDMITNGGRIFLSVDTGTATISTRDVLISRNSSGAS